MTEVTLELLGTQLERLFSEMREIHDDITVLAAIVNRQDATLNGILGELRALRQQMQSTRRRNEQRLDRLEHPVGDGA